MRATTQVYNGSHCCKRGKQIYPGKNQVGVHMTGAWGDGDSLCIDRDWGCARF